MLRFHMTHVAAFCVLVLSAGAVRAEAPPAASDIQRLIDKLGSSEYAEREAAGKRLEEIGADAVDALKAACKSEDPEVVRRAQEVLRKVERKLANEKALAPTLVQLDVRDQPLDAVLADLSKQARCDVVLGGLKPEELANRKITLTTGGNVPFWSAILKLCEAADLQVAVVGGYNTPGAMPYLNRSRGNVRTTCNANTAVVLEAHDANARKRPAVVHGAVLVEAIPFPANTSPGVQAAALLQVWPEPRLQWQATWNVKVSKAVDDRGERIRGEFVAIQPREPALPGGGAVVMIRNADGSVTMGARGRPGSRSPASSPPIRFKQSSASAAKRRPAW